MFFKIGSELFELLLILWVPILNDHPVFALLRNRVDARTCCMIRMKQSGLRSDLQANTGTNQSRLRHTTRRPIAARVTKLALAFEAQVISLSFYCFSRFIMSFYKLFVIGTILLFYLHHMENKNH